MPACVIYGNVFFILELQILLMRDKLINLSCMWLSKINNLIPIHAIYGAALMFGFF